MVKRAFVICMNNVVEAVVLDDDLRANEVMEDMSKIYYEKNRHAFGSGAEYRNRCFWHIHSLSVTK